MKRQIWAAACAVALLAAPAFAQGAGGPPPAAAPAFTPGKPCAPLPANAPVVPDGATARPSEMMKAQEAVQTWRTAVEPIIACKKAEAEWKNTQVKEEANAKMKANADEFNALIGPVNTLSEKWRAAVEIYQAKQAESANKKGKK